jgi:glycosyltransferase involved in cell wall biosynthesis
MFWRGFLPAYGEMAVNAGSVLFLTPRWARDGGVGTHVMTSAQALGRRGVEVRVLAARIDSGDTSPGVTLHHASRLFDRDATPDVRCGDGLSSLPSVVHVHQVDDPDVVAFLRLSAPVVISTHGYTACTSGVHYFGPGEECTRSHGPGCIPNLLGRGCAHSWDARKFPSSYARASRGLEALRMADLAISYSSAIDRHLAINGLPRRRVIPLFTTLVPKTGSGHRTRRRVVFAGRVIAPKGVGVLIRAARAVDAEFVICGDGWRLDAMRRLARALGVSERVSFRGWLGAGDLAHELAEASVVAIPSVWPEPFGLVGIEALACGRPVVASLTGGIGDWLEDGVSGLAVTPGDVPGLARALDELLADPVRQAKMGDAGKEMVSARFSTERHVDALLDAYAAARSTWRSDAREAALEPLTR